MKPELVELVQAIHEHDAESVETKEGHRYIEPETIKRLKHAAAERYGKIVIGRRVVVAVNGPEDASMVFGAVQPVEGEVLGHEKQAPGKHGIMFQDIGCNERMVIAPIQYKETQTLCNKVEAGPCNSEPETHQRVGELVSLPVSTVLHVIFHRHGDKIQGDEDEGQRCFAVHEAKLSFTPCFQGKKQQNYQGWK